MSKEQAFVYAVCGGAAHIRTLHRSIEYLRPRTKLPIIVVTDSRRNEIAIDHDAIVDVETPSDFNHHRASIFLKTSLHRLLPAGREYAYLDTDVIAAEDGVDTIFDHRTGPVTFARDLNFLGNRVGVFSPWAMNCSCSEQGGQPCYHLSEAIHQKFGVAVPDDWVQWNGGVFLFGPESLSFLNTWHQFTMDVFKDAAWKTRDQGTLIATVWTHGLQHQPALPMQFDFMVDELNEDLRFDREKGFSLHASIPCIRPLFLHLYHADLDRDGWNLEQDVTEAFEARAVAQLCQEQIEFKSGTALGMVDHQLGRTRLPAPDTCPPAAPYQVVFALPRWSSGVSTLLVESLVRGMLARGVEARLLLTEQDIASEPGAEPLPLPSLDFPVDLLPVSVNARWGARWGSLIRYLEDLAPCVYVPVGDWRHSVVSSQLSDRVAIAGVVLEDPRSFAEVEQLGRYWNGIVTTSTAVAALVRNTVKNLQPTWSGHISELPEDWRVSDTRKADMAYRCETLFKTIMHEAASGTFRRPKGTLRKPPYQAGGRPVFQVHYVRGIKGVGLFPSYREDYEAYRGALGGGRGAQLPEWSADLVQAHPALLGMSSSPGSQRVLGSPDDANARFVEAMLQGMQRIDHPAEVLPPVEPPRMPARLAGRDLGHLPPWKQRVEELAHYLENRSPCFFLPGSEPLHQWVCELLSDQVSVVGRVDTRDPLHLARAARSAQHWDALVAGDATIAEELLRLDPSLEDRLVTIPLPAPTPARLAGQPLAWGRRLRIAHLQRSASARARADQAQLVQFAAEQGVPLEWIAIAADQNNSVFETADVLLISSARDVNPWQVSEAMRQGCIPLVARDHLSPPPFLKDGENAYVVEQGDVRGFAARLRGLQGHAALQRAMAAKAYATTDVFTTSYAILFERVLREAEFGKQRRARIQTTPRLARKRSELRYETVGAGGYNIK